MMADFIVSIMGLFFRGPGLINDSYAEGPFLSGLCDIVPILTWSALYGASLAGIYGASLAGIYGASLAGIYVIFEFSSRAFIIASSTIVTVRNIFILLRACHKKLFMT